MALDKSKLKNINALLKDINTKFGNDSVSILSDVEDELKVKFYKTPSHEVNAMLGVSMSNSDVENSLNKLNFKYTK